MIFSIWDQIISPKFLHLGKGTPPLMLQTQLIVILLSKQTLGKSQSKRCLILNVQQLSGFFLPPASTNPDSGLNCEAASAFSESI